MVIIRCFEIAVQLHMTRQEESPIAIGRTTTHGRTDEGIFWFELTDGIAAISRAPDDDCIGQNT
jgi:hypothetical protein